MWAVCLHEEDPDEGLQGVQWMLLTNVATTDLEQAVEQARWYAARWDIEVFHRAINTGCQLEVRQLGYGARVENCLTSDMVVAWRIYYVTMLGRMEPQAPCPVFFLYPEWRVLYNWPHPTTQIPAMPSMLRSATRWIATKGGFQRGKSNATPAPR